MNYFLFYAMTSGIFSAIAANDFKFKVILKVYQLLVSIIYSQLMITFFRDPSLVIMPNKIAVCIRALKADNLWLRMI